MFYIVALGFFTITVLSIASGFIRSLNQMRIETRSTDQATALHLAESAVDQAGVALRTAPVTEIALTASHGGTYWAEVVTNGSQSTVTGHGQAGTAQRGVEAIVSVVPVSVFDFAMFGSTGINVSGNAITDSYDSRLGSYADQPHEDNGDVGTNATTEGGVTISGNIAINGQVAVGPGVTDPSSVVALDGGTALITGDPQFVSQTAEFSMPPVIVPEGLACPNLTVEEETVVLEGGGVYCFNRLRVAGGGVLTATGPVTVYLTSAFTMVGDASIGVPTDTTQMLFKVTSYARADIEGTIIGTTNFYGAIYGPEAEITIDGNANVYGSVIAQNVTVTGEAQIHYDEALGDSDLIINRHRTDVLSWRDL